MRSIARQKTDENMHQDLWIVKATSNVRRTGYVCLNAAQGVAPVGCERWRIVRATRAGHHVSNLVSSARTGCADVTRCQHDVSACTCTSLLCLQRSTYLRHRAIEYWVLFSGYYIAFCPYDSARLERYFSLRLQVLGFTRRLLHVVENRSECFALTSKKRTAVVCSERSDTLENFVRRRDWCPIYRAPARLTKQDLSPHFCAYFISVNDYIKIMKLIQCGRALLELTSPSLVISHRVFWCYFVSNVRYRSSYNCVGLLVLLGWGIGPT